MGEYAVIGKRLPKKDAKEKVCGQAKYAGDLVFNNILCGKILRSPHAHARIINIDTSKALKLKGVKAVVTGKDLTDIPHNILRISAAPPWFRDKFAIAKDKARYIGDEVAAVAATDEHIAEEALELIKVEYEELPAVFDVFEAMKPEAPRIHAHAEGNVSVKYCFEYGDAAKGFRESDFIFSERFETQYVSHAPLETHTAIADFSQSGHVTLWLSTQVPFYDQVVVAEALGIPVSNVRIIKPAVGGGFGGKAETHSIIVISAALSRAAGMSVKMVHTREEEIGCTSLRHPSFIEQKIGVKKDGSIMAAECINLTEGGAYNSYGPATLFLSGLFQNGPYKLKNFRYDGTRIYTNKPASGAMRGHGGVHVRFAIESLMDMIAEKLALDPLEMRIKNSLRAGDSIPIGDTINSCGYVECIEKARQEIGWQTKRGKLPDGQGVGMATGFFCSGASFTPFFDHPESHSAVAIHAHEDGRFTLLTGTSDIGQGSETILAQIIAEEVGVNLDDVNVIAADTGTTPMDMGSFSSRVTMFGGNAARSGALEMKKILLATAAKKLEASSDDLEARGGRIYVKGNPDKGLTVSETVIAYLDENKQPLITKGHYNPPGDDVAEFRPDTGKVNMTPAWSFGAHAAEVAVDRETGVVTVKKIAAAADCGFAINPLSVEGQIEGSVSMTFGQGLMEDVQVKNGHTMTPSFLEYRLPTALDNPPTKSLIVEANDKAGPYGAKEGSEGTNIPTIPAITNAIYDAIGVRIKSLPITPEKILKGLKEKNKRRPGQ